MRDSTSFNVLQIRITYYLNKFEKLYYEIQRFEMNLTSPVLAYRMLYRVETCQMRNNH